MMGKDRSLGKDIGVAGLGVVAVLYLLNIGVGFIELLPDAIPLLGNLDEASATFILLACLQHFGIDLFDLLKKTKK